jgi:mutual gliding-motility protein MglA
MSFINYALKEINCKVIYWGPSLSGKTTNLKYLSETYDPKEKGDFISFNSNDSESLIFDFLPISMGEINGFKTRFHLYSMPGKIKYDMSNKLILKGVDGIVFVADSQRERLDANIKSMEKLESYLIDYGYEVDKMPMVIEINKKDLKNSMSSDELSKRLYTENLKSFDTVAQKGQGVYDVLKGITKIVLEKLKT